MATADARVVFATAGHVDHGKTTLIRALTGTDTDRLPDEKRRGISIELGFAELPETGISFIDVPGHKKLVHAMIAGVGGVDGVLLVVAADDAVMPQTREHLWVCALLGIRRFVVALSKADLVDAETLELAEADIRSTLESMGLETLAVVPTSATDGRGVEELRAELCRMAAGVTPAAESARLWLPIDRVFSVRGAGTVVTGTLTRGTLHAGDALWVVGESGRQETACRGLEVHGEGRSEVRAPSRVAVNLARVDVADVHRGDVISADAELPSSKRLDVALTPLPGTSLRDGTSVLVYVGTTRRTARLTHIGEGVAHLALDAPLPCQGRVGYVLRGFRSTRDHGAVLGGGRVIDAAAPPLPRRRDAAKWELRAKTLTELASGDWLAALGGLLALSAPRALDSVDAERRFGIEPGEIARALGGKRRKGPADTLVLPGGTEFTHPENLERRITELTRLLAEYHAERPHEAGLSLETARAVLAKKCGRALAELAVERAAKSGRVRVDHGVVCLPEFAETAGPAAKQAAEALLTLLDEIALEGAVEAFLIKKTGESPERVRAALSKLQGEGRARRLSTLWFSEAQLERVRAKVHGFFAEHSEMSVPEFKDLAGVSRKQAIPLLEQLDREGTTRRQGDLRIAGKPADLVAGGGPR
ncbi:MAG: selenocysteine-specific translation elongation factor [Myxococcales bacterium]|nr:selenocysteine-specific translation elongation factor [Myxococcales bacterium]MCB9578164.1 selenocysteine-specific translation elongation factor [Polyangiaceae bacterium]